MTVELMISLLFTLAIAVGMWVTFQRMQNLKPVRIKAQYRKKDRWDNPNPRD
ncbi:hypothetical protein [Oceanospirillum sediminis]|uniref:Uncharacterized protein n=1 Tax=Oceanospirillum sediminis TaxID=2760088 RepID=A0A839IKC8_9GAMM|nr:hypothetical protein [Oceanospirillum sediminis]MBB1485351.1 hypothetical protein [Oceanospirillum sediminis]